MALTATGALSPCLKTLIVQLNAINAPINYNGVNSIAAINALESPRNKAGLDPNLFNQIKGQWGKHKLNNGSSTCKFKLWVEKPRCAVPTELKELCGNTNTNNPSNQNLEYDISIVQGLGLDGRISPVDIACLNIGTQAEVLQREITNAMKEILTQVNKDVISAMAAKMGAYSTGIESLTSPMALNLFTTANGNFQLQPAAWMPMMLEYAKMQTQGGVIAIGGDLAFQYNAMPGLTRSITGAYQLPNDIDLYYDQNLQAVLAADDPTIANPLITFAPGSLGLMRYLDNWNVPENHVESPDVSRGIVSYAGHDFDISIKRTADCDYIRWVVNYVWDLYALPVEAFGGCADTNQRLMFDVGCEPYSCEQLAPPAA